MPTDAMRVDAPAKINLTLRILDRRPDGYHELDTLFQAISLTDEVLIVPREAPGVGLTVVDADVGPAEDNLALRAARAWADASGVDPKVHIRLTKRIPAGAGLGGGSSDAGAVLRGLEAMHGGPLGTERIADIGVTLGADVPFFCGEAALARGQGIGERLDPLAAMPPRDLIVVVPEVPVPTASAYGWLAANRREGAPGAEPGRGAGRPIAVPIEGGALGRGRFEPAWSAIDHLIGNDFHAVVAARVPAVAAAVRALEAVGLEHVLLSGSGSAVFGFPTDDIDTSGVVDRLRSALPEARIFPATTLDAMPAPYVAGERG
jgi:4-diphosphocytidyl-2-C-methyl-D-erythritol kinase